MHTVTSHDREAVVAAHVVKYYSGVDGEKAGEPLPTVTAIDHYAVCAAHGVKYKRDEVGTRPAELRPTQTAGGVFGCCKAVLCKIGSAEWRSLPLSLDCYKKQPPYVGVRQLFLFSAVEYLQTKSGRFPVWGDVRFSQNV